jgi:predicted nucleotide-binding protein (sugar kinase/HSP70/actin superfamily)
MLAGLLTTFRHELVSTVLVTAFLGAITMPFRKVMAAYREAKEKLESISKELTEQRTNHLSHIETSNEKQVELLGKMTDVLTDVRLDLRETLGKLSK